MQMRGNESALSEVSFAPESVDHMLEKRRVPRVTRITREELEARYLTSPGQPIVLTNVARSWPACKKWTFQYLSDLYGHSSVVAADRLITPNKAFQLSLRTFLRFCENPSLLEERVGPVRLYVGLQPLCLASSLTEDFVWPKACDNLYAHLGDEIYDWYLREFGVLLIGPAGTVTPDHVDLFGTHAWLAQLHGRKHFDFESPSVGAQKERSPSPGRFNWEAELGPGDIIILPQGWTHRVTSLTPSISLSFNFVNHTNFGAHLLEICRDLPAWVRRLNSPQIRKTIGITWSNPHFPSATAR
jgi:hypothetical protein